MGDERISAMTALGAALGTDELPVSRTAGVLGGKITVAAIVALTTGITGPTGPAGPSSGLVLYFNHTTDVTAVPTTSATLVFSAAANTIVRSTGSFLTDGWVARQKCTISGTVSNNKTVEIRSVTALTITLCATSSLANETHAAVLTVDNEGLNRTPVGGVEVTETITGIDSTDVDGIPFDNYLTVVGVPNTTVIPAGIWQFYGVFSATNASCTAAFEVCKRSADGLTTSVLFTSGRTTGLTTSLAVYRVTATVAADIPIAIGDRIVIRVLGYNSGGARNMVWAYQGLTRASYVVTSFYIPLVITSPTYVLFGNALGIPTGSSSLTWNDVTKVLAVGGTISNPVLTGTAKVPDGFGNGVTSTVTSATPLTLTATSRTNQLLTGSTAQAVTLSSAAALGAGVSQYFWIHNQSSATATFYAAGGDNIAGVASFRLYAGQTLRLWSDGVHTWCSSDPSIVPGDEIRVIADGHSINNDIITTKRWVFDQATQINELWDFYLPNLGPGSKWHNREISLINVAFKPAVGDGLQITVRCADGTRILLPLAEGLMSNFILGPGQSISLYPTYKTDKNKWVFAVTLSTVTLSPT